jgi:hypothetical protein
VKKVKVKFSKESEKGKIDKRRGLKLITLFGQNELTTHNFKSFDLKLKLFN